MALNNPFNIRHSVSNAWQGQIKPLDGFCQFETFEDGVRAYWLLMKTYVCKYRLRTVCEILTRYAPSSENPLETYINFCVGRVFPDNLWFCDTQRLVLSQYDTLSLAMFRFETGREATFDQALIIGFGFDNYFVPSYKRVYG